MNDTDTPRQKLAENVRSMIEANLAFFPRGGGDTPDLTSLLTKLQPYSVQIWEILCEEKVNANQVPVESQLFSFSCESFFSKDLKKVVRS